jgi:hypothetical protein
MSSYRGPDLSELRARRRLARRRRRLARIDVGLGVLVAIVLLIVSPGLAITGLVALATLGVCLVSLALERRRSARAGNQRRRSADGVRAGAGAARGRLRHERRAPGQRPSRDVRRAG